MLRLLKSLTILVVLGTLSATPHSQPAHQSWPNGTEWTLSEIICLDNCTQETLATVTPYINRQLGFGSQLRSKFGLLDQCSGTTTIETKQENTEDVINTIRNAAPRPTKLKLNRLQLSTPKILTGLALCEDPPNNVAPEGDVMFRVVSIDNTHMLVWFENMIFLRFYNSSPP